MKTIKNKLGLSQNRWHYVFAVFFLATLVFNLFKVRVGYVYNDEPFYITIAQRLLQGDVLFVDEYHVAQLLSIFYAPIIALYDLIHPSFFNDGIVLFTRYVYLMVWTIVCLIVYWRLNRIFDHPLMNILAFVYLVIYAPLGQMQMSYNVFGLIGILLAIVTVLDERPSRLKAILIGLFTVMSGFVTPYYVVVALLICGVVIVSNLLRFRYAVLDQLFKKLPILQWRYFSFSVLTGFVCVVCFGIYIVTHMSIDQFINGVTIILTDPSHSNGNIFYRFYRLIYSLAGSFPFMAFLGAPVFIASWFLKKYRKSLFLTQVSITLINLIWILLHLNQIGALYNIYIVPLCYLGFVCLPWVKDVDQRICVFFGLSALYAIALYYSSNLLATAFSTGIVACIPASLVLIDTTIHDLFSIRSVKPIAIISIIVPMVIVGWIRFYQTYRDADVFRLTHRINDGPLQGLYVDAEKFAYTTSITADFKQYASLMDADSHLLVLSKVEWIYLIADTRFATFSSWAYFDDMDEVERLRQYYTIADHQGPDIIYALKSDFSEGQVAMILDRLDIVATNVHESDVGWLIEVY